IEREAEAPLGKPLCAAMAGRTALRKQFWRGLTRIEIFLRPRRGAAQHGNGGERERAARTVWRHRILSVQGRASSAEARADQSCRPHLSETGWRNLGCSL